MISKKMCAVIEGENYEAKDDGYDDRYDSDDNCDDNNDDNSIDSSDQHITQHILHVVRIEGWSSTQQDV